MSATLILKALASPILVVNSLNVVSSTTIHLALVCPITLDHRHTVEQNVISIQTARTTKPVFGIFALILALVRVVFMHFAVLQIIFLNVLAQAKCKEIHGYYVNRIGCQQTTITPFASLHLAEASRNAVK